MKLQILSQRELIAQLFLLAVVLLVHTPRAKAQVFQYSPYWGLGGWVSDSYVPPTSLQITRVADQVSVQWPGAVTNALLQTTSDITQNSWGVVPVLPTPSENLDQQTVLLPATNTQQFFRLSGVETAIIPVFSFAVFFDGPMEFTQCAPQVIRGRTHANGPILLGPGSSSSLTFTEMVTTSASIIWSNLAGFNYALPGSRGVVTYAGNPGTRSGVPTLRFPIGTNNTPAARREILYPPPAGEAALSPLGQQRFYNNAAVLVLVSNSTVTLTVKPMGQTTGSITTIAYDSASPTATQRTNLAQILPFITLTNRFRDYREGKSVMPVQIDVAKFGTWLRTNSVVASIYPALSGSYPSVLYAADFRNLAELQALRLANGMLIPTNGPSATFATGLTIATPNPIYVWGHYNCPDPAALGTSDTSHTFPAALVGDALTVLSENWNDSTYGSTYSLIQRTAADTTINAAILVGSVYTTGTNQTSFSGGVYNVPRLLEDWSNASGGAQKKLTLNTSIVNLFDSAKATNQFQWPGTYYYSPNRNFNFNTNYLLVHKLPSATPLVIATMPIP